MITSSVPANPPITITDTDLARLWSLLDHYDDKSTQMLDSELYRATVVPQRTVAPNVVTMNSEVVYEDTHSGVRRTVRVVYPRDADAALGRVSVLAPIGSALLGLEVGREIDWRLPRGSRRLRIVEIRYQPEASRDYAL